MGSSIFSSLIKEELTDHAPQKIHRYLLSRTPYSCRILSSSKKINLALREKTINNPRPIRSLGRSWYNKNMITSDGSGTQSYYWIRSWRLERIYQAGTDVLVGKTCIWDQTASWIGPEDEQIYLSNMRMRSDGIMNWSPNKNCRKKHGIYRHNPYEFIYTHNSYEFA